MEKCTFCVQRIRRTKRGADRDGRTVTDGDRALTPACVNACPTQALNFGDIGNPETKVSKMIGKEKGDGGRGYHLLEKLGTNTNVVYLKKVDEHAEVLAHG